MMGKNLEAIFEIYGQKQGGGGEGGRLLKDF